MKTTKKQIKESTITKKGEGWNPNYYFITHIDDMRFEKPMHDDAVFLTTLNSETEFPETRVIGHVENKKEYVELIYRYIND